MKLTWHRGKWNRRSRARVNIMQMKSILLFIDFCQSNAIASRVREAMAHDKTPLTMINGRGAEVKYRAYRSSSRFDHL